MPQSLISYIDRAALAKLRDEGKLADGMLPKAAAIDAALANGVQRVHVISYKLDGQPVCSKSSPTRAPARWSSMTSQRTHPGRTGWRQGQ